MHILVKCSRQRAQNLQRPWGKRIPVWLKQKEHVRDKGQMRFEDSEGIDYSTLEATVGTLVVRVRWQPWEGLE